MDLLASNKQTDKESSKRETTISECELSMCTDNSINNVRDGFLDSHLQIELPINGTVRSVSQDPIDSNTYNSEVPKIANLHSDDSIDHTHNAYTLADHIAHNSNTITDSLVNQEDNVIDRGGRGDSDTEIKLEYPSAPLEFSSPPNFTSPSSDTDSFMVISGD